MEGLEKNQIEAGEAFEMQASHAVTEVTRTEKVEIAEVSVTSRLDAALGGVKITEQTPFTASNERGEL